MAAKRTQASTKESATLPTPAAVTAPFPSRLPSSRLKRKPRSGRTGMSQAVCIRPSLLQGRGAVRVGGAPQAVEADDEGQADGGFAGGHGDDHEVEDRGLGIAPAPAG